MPERSDILDAQLRALTRRAFDDAVLVRRRVGRLNTRGGRLGPVVAAVAVAAAVGVVAAVTPLRPHEGVRTQTPEVRPVPAPIPTAGPLPARTPLDALDPALTAYTADAAGNLYLAEGFHRRVVKVTRDGTPSLLAGPALPGSAPAESGPAATGIVGDVIGIAVDGRGLVYILDSELGVRRISPDGHILTLARSHGTPLYASIPSQQASIAVTSSGTVYVACGDCHPPGSRASGDVYSIGPDGAVRVVAGGDRSVTGAAAAGLVRGAAGSTLLASPVGVAVDARGDVFIADSGNNRVREIGVDGHVSTVAGDDRGVAAFSGDGGPATDARLNNPQMLVVDAAGNLFILDAGNDCVREVTGGTIRTVAGKVGTGGSPPSPPFPAVAGRVFFTDLTPIHTRTIWAQSGALVAPQEGP